MRTGVLFTKIGFYPLVFRSKVSELLVWHQPAVCTINICESCLICRRRGRIEVMQGQTEWSNNSKRCTEVELRHFAICLLIE